jgi:methyl-accepting chemotaxis protein
MTKMLANLKIGKKLMLLLSTGIGPIVCLGVLGLWALGAIRDTVSKEQLEAEKMMSAQRVASGLGRVNSVVGHITLSRRCENCHGNSMGGNRENEAALAKECIALLSELKAREDTADGQKLVNELAEASTHWLDADVRALQLGQAGKREQASAVYREESIPGAGPVDHALRNYLNWERPRLAEKKQQAETIRSQMPIAVGGLALFALVASAMVGIVVTRSIQKPLAAAVTHIGDIASGDVSKEVEPEYLARADEFGDMSRAIRTMTGSLREVLREIGGGVHTLSSSATQLSSTSGQMSGGSRNTSEKAHSVAAAAEQLSANAVSVAASMEQTSSNLSYVTSSTEQMTSTIGEIASNSEKARRITEEATRQATRITEKINELGQAAQAIGKVTETITEISSQTNLLALNATIEAARAGAAGKGFAVVANEIKELAQQTAAATEDIKTRIAGVQSSTASGITEIERVSEVIHEVSQIVVTIATAIEEQATVTKDIASNIGQASVGVADANMRVAQTSQASQEIARNIADVDGAAREMADGSEQVRASAGELTRVAEQLQATVARFHV